MSDLDGFAQVTMDRDLGLLPTRFSQVMHNRGGSHAQSSTYREIAKEAHIGGHSGESTRT